MQSPELYIRRCFELAQLAKGNTAPNPMVGAVLVHNDKIIGEGWHKQYGQNHAEVNCIESVKEADRQFIPESTMYVSLEPCAHYGKTPPCALRLVQEKVKEVVIANIDPFAEVGGRGIEILKQHNIKTTTGILESEGLWINRRFFCFHTKKRPYIILKWAETEDGFIAPSNRSRLQISNRHSSLLVHKWRAEEAAIMVGYNTAKNDNPQLTVRNIEGKQPLRIVLDRNLSLDNSLNLFNNDAPTWVINEKKEAAVDNLYYTQLPFDDNLLAGVLERLYNAKILSLIVEGGAVLLQSFIDKGLWDEARIFTGTASLQEGIKAPQLKYREHVIKTPIADDVLNVYTNKNAAYQYIKGLEL